MKSRNLILGWLAGGMLTMAFASGCITQGGSSPELVYDLKLHFYTVKGADLLPDSYDFVVTGKGADGLLYRKEVYFLRHKSAADPGDVPVNPWDSRPGHGRRTKTASDDGSDFGWYTQITHPPGGGYIECGTETMITHPPGGASATTAK